MRPRARDAAPQARSDLGRDGDLIGWRQRQLMRAGFDAHLAAHAAGDPSVDIHALLELVDSGCPPTLAARILAPLDHEAHRC